MKERRREKGREEEEEKEDRYGSLGICRDCYVSKDSGVLNLVS